jgi:transglutaminase-like putative cysteine protease
MNSLPVRNTEARSGWFSRKVQINAVDTSSRCAPPARRLEQTVRYAYSAPVTDLHQRLILIPPAQHGGQRRLDWTLEVGGIDQHRTRTRCDRWGNLVLDVRVPRVDEFVEFTVTATTSHDPVVPTRVRPSDRYFASTPLTSPGGRIAELAAGLTGAGPAEVCAAVYRSIRYEFGVTDVWTTAAEALEVGRGVCQDFAHVMLATCRLMGLPARYVSGHLHGEGGSHAWVEILSPDAEGGLVAEAWDPTHDRKTDDRYLTVATGRDYADVAPLCGSFENDGASSSLKVAKRVTAV